MNKALRRTLIIASAFLFVFYIIYQAASYFDSPYKTVVAANHAVTHTITADGVFIRDEIVIPAENNGVLSYTVRDGEKISKGTVVANLFGSVSDVESVLEAERLANKIEMLKSAQDPGAIASIDLEGLSNKIYENYGDLLDIIDTKDLSAFYEKKDKLLILLNRQQMATGTVSGFEQRIGVLEAEIARLNAKTTTKPREITSPHTGFFVSKTDGYETVLTKEAVLEEMSVSELSGKIKEAKGNAAVTYSGAGKIVLSYEWYYCIVVNKEQASGFSVGSAVDLVFSFTDENGITVEVDAIRPEGENVAVIFKCAIMSPNVASQRGGSVTVNFKRYSGIKVDRKALRVVDGEMGVYVKTGFEAEFKKIEEIYGTDEFILSKNIPGDNLYLQPNSEIITDGKDIYAGKHLR